MLCFGTLDALFALFGTLDALFALDFLLAKSPIFEAKRYPFHLFGSSGRIYTASKINSHPLHEREPLFSFMSAFVTGVQIS